MFGTVLSETGNSPSRRLILGIKRMGQILVILGVPQVSGTAIWTIQSTCN